MKTLCISLYFLDDRFHGKGDDGPEWPPSPFRLYQAILAAVSRNGNIDESAFKWLECQPSPMILAPHGVYGQKYKSYVPNNDSDKQMDRQKRLAEKSIEPIKLTMNYPVHYLWQIRPDDYHVAEKIIGYAQKLYAVGWGIDLVAGSGGLLSKAATNDLISRYPGNQWLPTVHANLMLRCPKQGSFDDLKNVYQSFLNRFEDNVYRPSRKPIEFTETSYSRGGVPQRKFMAFKLLLPDDDSDRWASFDQRKVIEVAAWIRGYLCSVSRNHDFLGDSEIYVAGHVQKDPYDGKQPPRFSYLPVPSIGHEHADGRIRRLIIAEPYGGNGRYAGWARQTLTNATLKDINGKSQARLEPLPSLDSVIRHYIHPSKTFHSITPVILPGFDDLKYKKAEKLLLKSIEHAGFSIDDLADWQLRKAPFRKSSYGPRSYKPPKYLQKNSSMHMRLVWKNSISGPLAIGAGRHIGLGLFAPEAE